MNLDLQSLLLVNASFEADVQYLIISLFRGFPYNNAPFDGLHSYHILWAWWVTAVK